MTFASTVRMLKYAEKTLRRYTSETYPRDFEMFTELSIAGLAVVTPIPGYSTHGESRWLSPLINWEQHA